MGIHSTSNYTDASQVVNKLGKYLYKNIDGAFRINYSSNACDVYMIILYAIPTEELPSGTSQTIYEMAVDLNITTYQNKIRVNAIETDPNERTLGCDVISLEKVNDFGQLRKLIFNKLVKHIQRTYSDYEVLF